MRGLDAKRARQVVERTSEMGGEKGWVDGELVQWKGRGRMLTEGRRERRWRVKESERVY